MVTIMERFVSTTQNLKGIKGISSPSTISTANKELEEKGWIKRTKLGGLYRTINEYKLTGNFDEYLQ